MSEPAATVDLWMYDVLSQLADEAIVVGPSARPGPYATIELVVSSKGERRAHRLLDASPPPIPITILRKWNGPDYNSLARRAGLKQVTLFGVALRAWPYDGKRRSAFTAVPHQS